MTDEAKSAAAPKPAAPKKKTAAPAVPVETFDAPTEIAIEREAYAVYGNAPRDEVVYSRARKPGAHEGRKSVTVLHLQRALGERGYSDADAAPGGRFEALTERAVEAYQKDAGAEVTGVLTREQFVDIFQGDPNVNAVVDTTSDHAV